MAFALSGQACASTAAWCARRSVRYAFRIPRPDGVLAICATLITLNGTSTTTTVTLAPMDLAIDKPSRDPVFGKVRAIGRDQDVLVHVNLRFERVVP